ncbi:MAG TPA: cytochrome c biogenesis protein CcdA [Nitriliruptorales bacterium]
MADLARELITDANVLIGALVAFVAGVLSFASPCVVPLVPGYLSFMTGLSGQDLQAGSKGARSRVVAGGILFVLGFAIPFAMLGFAAGLLNTLLQNRGWQVALGLLVVVFGVLMASGRLVREYRVADEAPKGGVASAAALGFIFGVGWVPCIGPALAAILALAASTGASGAKGAVLAFVYALGLGLPFLVIGVLFRRLAGALDFLRRNARNLQVVGGAMLGLVGVLIAVGWWNDFLLWIQTQPFFRNFEPPI